MLLLTMIFITATERKLRTPLSHDPSLILQLFFFGKNLDIKNENISHTHICFIHIVQNPVPKEACVPKLFIYPELAIKIPDFFNKLD